MLRLAAVIYILLGATLAGILIVAALTVGMDTAQPIIYAAIAGFVVAAPVSWVVAKQING
jgi:hypothetical protein